MKFQLIYDPEALPEYKDATLWYLDKNEEIANNFIVEVSEKLQQRFPYNIVYMIDEVRDTIIITGIFHHKRNPTKKYRE